jgi:hypothetical protein
MAYGIVKVDNITFDNGGSDQNVTVSGLYRATTSGVTVSGTIAAGTVSGVTVIGSTTVSGTTVTGTTANFTSGNFSNIISSAATMSGALIMANQQQVRFREAVGNGVNHIALQAPAIVSADQTITLPDQTGTVVTTGDNGSVTSTMILDGTIVNDDINASAAIDDTKLATISTAGKVSNSATTATNANTASAIVARDASGDFAAGDITISDKIIHAGDTNTAIRFPAADTVSVETGGDERLRVSSAGRVGIGITTSSTVGVRIVQDAEGADLIVVSGNWTATTGTISSITNFQASRSTAGATITNLYGFSASSILTSATNNYGFYSDLASATGRHNFYANGTAPNYFAGDLRTDTVVTARTAPNNSNISATATASSLLNGLRTGTPTGNITLTLPTGTDMDAAFQDLQTNQSFEWSVINLAAATHIITVTAAATGHTVVGNMAVAAASSGRFLTRKTAANTFISYRIA